MRPQRRHSTDRIPGNWGCEGVARQCYHCTLRHSMVWNGTHLPALPTIRPPPLGFPRGLGGLRLGGLGGLARGWRHLALGGAVQALDPPDVVLVQLQVRPGGRVAAGWKQDLALVIFSPKIYVLTQEVRFHKTLLTSKYKV